MCLVIDTCTFRPVFDEHAQNHARFIPIVEWLTKGKGKIIFGGTKFKREVKGSVALKILGEFEKRNKLVRVSDARVDKLAKELKERVGRGDFDDEHIVALVSITRCCVVCTDDKRAIPFLKMKELYPKGVKRPRIYKQPKPHSQLCCDANIVAVCQ